MKKILIGLSLLMLLCCTAALADEGFVTEANQKNFAVLLQDLLSAYETPCAEDEQIIARDLESIRAASAADYELAQAIAGHWRLVYGSDYILHCYQGGEYAPELEGSGIPDTGSHAFVVLGYQLSNGEMAEELKGRCRAAAAAAHSFPKARIVCSGGATGSGNPDKHTEAGMMKAYLSQSCGIEPGRILTDEEAMTTVENAVNTFRILMENDIHTITIVTSSYHQRWGQTLYNAMAALYRQRYGFAVEIVENYCFEIEPSKQSFRQDARMAQRQLGSLLGLPAQKK